MLIEDRVLVAHLDDLGLLVHHQNGLIKQGGTSKCAWLACTASHPGTSELRCNLFRGGRVAERGRLFKASQHAGTDRIGGLNAAVADVIGPLSSGEIPEFVPPGWIGMPGIWVLFHVRNGRCSGRPKPIQRPDMDSPGGPDEGPVSTGGHFVA